MNLTDAIESAELRFRQILEEFFISVYDEESLPSHGIDHHRRVWSYSKELLLLFNDSFSTGIYQLTSNLLIASYLHDIGMSAETGVRHGKHSMDICSRFLRNNNLPVDEYQDALTAIENHDRKDYRDDTPANDLLKILSVADDLDAFGFTGIFRYSEIYLTRGTDPREIGKMINENAGKRFDNFLATYGFSDSLVQKHRKRYEILLNFFNEYNKQALSYQFGGNSPNGYCGVIELLTDVINKKIKLKDICREPEIFSNDPVINWFFKGLLVELLVEN